MLPGPTISGPDGVFPAGVADVGCCPLVGELEPAGVTGVVGMTGADDPPAATTLRPHLRRLSLRHDLTNRRCRRERRVDSGAGRSWRAPHRRTAGRTPVRDALFRLRAIRFPRRRIATPLNSRGPPHPPRGNQGACWSLPDSPPDQPRSRGRRHQWPGTPNRRSEADTTRAARASSPRETRHWRMPRSM